jgi:MarR family transcriptional regulator, lower aerobic nicotinate degradation pathway regulator
MPTRTVVKIQTQSTWIDQFEKQIGFLLRKASQRNLAIFQRQAPLPNLTSVQAAALIVLMDHSPCSLTTLGHLAVMDPATTRGVAERLAERHLISLLSDPKDKRKVIVRLDRKGRHLATELIPILFSIADETMASLNEAERAMLLHLLCKMTAGGDKS